MGSHYVPQQYLRGFQCVDQPGKVWVYDKLEKCSRLLPIKVVAEESEYYDAEAERTLSQRVEGPAHAALARILRREKPLSADRKSLAIYIAAMMVRVPRRRRKAEELYPSTLRKLVEEFRGHVKARAQYRGKEKTEQTLAEVDRIEQKMLRGSTPEVQALIRSPMPRDSIVQHVENMPWRIVRAPAGENFLTSDNPAHYFDGLGIGRPESESVFPLSSQAAIMACWHGAKSSWTEVHGKAALVREINRRVASGAERFVFSHANEPWIAKIADKARPRFNRMMWT